MVANHHMVERLGMQVSNTALKSSELTRNLQATF